MKKFFLNLLSSFVGAWIAICLFGVVAVIIIVSMIAGLGVSDKNKEVSKHSVMCLTLSGEISEREASPELSATMLLKGEYKRPQTLDALVRSLDAASENKKIEALYIKCEGVSASPATLNALRNAVLKFKKESGGKKIYAYGDAITQGDYYVASVADSIFLNPEGNVEINGINGYSPYFKNFLDKIGVSFQVVKVGTYKSAVEPYMLSEMSTPARAQLDTLYGEMWTTIKNGICDVRKNLTPEKIDSLINRDFVSFKPATFTASAGLVDGICYEREMDSRIADYLGIDKDEINYVDPSVLISEKTIFTTNLYGSNKQIAVLYACGEIEGSSGGIQAKQLVPQILELAKNDDVRGLVMRVNSPGGSAFASEQIWDALEQFKKTGKPFAVSMGDYAASGGYYISSGADRIFADQLTITGSIGIFGMFPTINGLIHDKLGVNMELTGTNPDAVFPSLFHPMSSRQHEALQQYVDRGYEVFVSRCALGRKMSADDIKRIGEGRVWSAPRAVQLGLVDSIGSLEDAVLWVADKADVDKYDVVSYPKLESSFLDVMSMIDDNTIRIATLILGKNADEATVKLLLKLLGRRHVLALAPEIYIKM